jgi:hypothetical protein
MNDMGMTCKGCSFEKGETCSIGILENIKEESSVCNLVDGHYQFNRICPHRNGENLTEEQSFQKASLPISFIVLDDDLEKTNGILETIKSATQGERAYNICIVTFENFKDLRDLADKYLNYYVIKSFSEDRESKIRDAFLKMTNGYSMIIDSEEGFDVSSINNLNLFVNKKMKRVGLISDSPYTVNNMLFKYLKGNKIVSYEEKLNTLSEEQEVTKMVYTWKELNEAVNS